MINERIANLASKIAAALITTGYITEEQHEPTIKIVGDLIDAEVHPLKCEDCGTLLCPVCAGHTEDAMQEPTNEGEGLPVCPYCGVYVKEDRTTIPATFDTDRRFTKAAEALSRLFGGMLPGGPEPPATPDIPPDWKN